MNGPPIGSLMMMDPIKKYIFLLLTTATATLLVIFTLLYANQLRLNETEKAISEYHEYTLSNLVKIRESVQAIKSLLLQEALLRHIETDEHDEKSARNPERDTSFDFDNLVIHITENVARILGAQEKFGDPMFAGAVKNLIDYTENVKTKKLDDFITDYTGDIRHPLLDGLFISIRQIEILHSHVTERLRKGISDRRASGLTEILSIVLLILLVGVFIVYRLFKLVNASLVSRGRIEEELRVLNDELENRIAARTRENQMILNAAGEGIYGVDLNGLCTFINPAAEKLLGWKKQELIGQSQHDNLHHTKPDGSNYPRSESPIYAAFLDGKVHAVDDEVFWCKDGRSFPVEYLSTPIFEEGKAIGAVVVFHDITERKRSEQALKEAHQLNDTIFSSSPVGIAMYDPAGRCISANEASAGIVGISHDQALAQNYHEIDSWKESGFYDKALESLSTGDRTRIETQFKKPSGTIVFLDCYFIPVNLNDKRHLVFIINDVTENRNMQEQLIQSSKMATLGEMATGVAHELNQPLNVIRMAVNNIKRKSDKNEAGPEYLVDKLGKVERQIERATAIIDHMRIFGRRPGTEPQFLDAMKMVNGSLGLIREQLRLSMIDVAVEGPEVCRPFRGHQVQVEQVLLNLLTNARDALLDKGEGGKRVGITVEDRVEDIIISVEDTGGGIAPDALARIFEPFYTTKEIGKGTGLGLSISYGIITDMGGMIEAENTDIGARFVITLPVCEEEKKTPQVSI